MEFLFIDESGDNGLVKGSSDFYILAGISIEDQCWKKYYWEIQNLRFQIAKKYGLTINELKGSELFSHRGPFFKSRLTPRDLEWVYDQIMDLICDPRGELFAIVKSKEEFTKRYYQAEVKIKSLVKTFNNEIWGEYLSFYEEHVKRKSIKKGYPHTTLIYVDHPGYEKHIRQKVREYSRTFPDDAKFPGEGIVEDCIFRDSQTSHFIQLADILAFSINRLVTGKGNRDVITIKRSIIEKLKSKLNGQIDFKKLPS